MPHACCAVPALALPPRPRRRGRASQPRAGKAGAGLYQARPDAGDPARHCGRGDGRARWSISRTGCRHSRKRRRAPRSTSAFGKPVEALFSSFGAPLAAASIAQVHRAQTSDNPPVRVAVKILRPHVRRRLRPRPGSLGLVRPRRRTPFGRGAAAAPDCRGARRLRRRWRWNWTCAWKRRRLPNCTSAPAARSSSACRTSTGAAPRSPC